MSDNSAKAPVTVKALKRPVHRRLLWLGLVLAVAGLILAGSRIYDFLAVPTRRVQAEILVVEGWIFDYALQAAAAEFEDGSYALVATSGQRIPSADPNRVNDSYALRAARDLESAGVAASRIIVCPSPSTSWNRTSSSARAVRARLAALGVSYRGINVLTVGPHARQTWLAYRRIMGPNVRVGIVTVPKKDFIPGRWWASARGVRMVLKDLAGWFREWLFGLRR